MSVQALREQRASKVNALSAAVNDAELFASIEAEIADLDGQISRHEKAVAAVATLKAPAAPVAAPAADVRPTVPAAPKAEKGLRFGAAMRALAAAGGDRNTAVAVAERWGHSGLFAQQSGLTGGAGGFLIPEDVSGELIELLRPASVVMSFQPVIMPMDNGNLTMNRIAVGTTANYIGETQDVPATGVQFGQIKLSSKKLAALVPISNDLLQSASTQADAVVRDDLVLSLATRMDLAFIRGAGTQFTPLGMRNQLIGTAFETTNILAANNTVNLTNVTNDLGRLELALLNANIPMVRPGWIFAPRTMMYLMNLRDGNGNYAFPEMQNGQLRGKPYRTTTNVPINLGSSESEIYLADFAHVVVGEQQGIELAISTEAAYRDAGNNLQASFSRDETVVRAIAKHDFALRHLPAIAILTGVTWAP
ncbi:phage major capsid protein [Sandarakinorhabdus sp.]|uniref:phage major capsid protein n=1 Tax=Sandarakinorhabdus sp. TaxID=1916663 RepID=UPI0028AAABF6|nr:phage major capsid protein [Sandarakinorhabdus sp.]